MQNQVIELPIEYRSESSYDSQGFWHWIVDEIRIVRANIKDVTRQDELLAKESGYTASIIVEIAKCAYNDEAQFGYNGRYYDVKRTYAPDKSFKVQLTGELREHGKFPV